MAYKICPNCRMANKEHAKKCIHCGCFIGNSNNYIENCSKNKIPLGFITLFLSFVFIFLVGFFWIDENYVASFFTLSIGMATISILLSKINKRFLERHPEQAEKIREIQEEKDRRNKIILEYRKSNIKFCPYCLSTDFQYAGRTTVGARDAKTKTSYKANLNPLKPFTLVDKKEKVVRKASSGYSYDEFICLKCGKRFR